MKTLKLSDSVARGLYRTGSNELKTILEESFGKDFFSEKLTECVKTIDDVYLRLDRRKPLISDYKFLPEEQREKALNTQYIEDISELFNEGWKPDFTNRNQYKYYNWFERKNSSWVFCDCYYLFYFSGGRSGFYFKDRETATYCGNQFLNIYSKILE